MVAMRDPKIPEAKKEVMRKVLETLNGYLEGKKWMAGDESASIADFSILSNLIVILVSTFSLFFVMDMEFQVLNSQCAGIRIDTYINLKAWFERCKELKGFEENYKGGKMVATLLKMRNLPPVSIS